MQVASRRDKEEKRDLPTMEVTGEDLQKIDSILNKHGREKSSLINILHALQDEYHYLPQELMEILSQELDIPYTKIFALGTFYDAFFMKPLGKYKIDACMGTTCYNEGASEILEALEDYVDIERGNTREDGLFTLIGVHCLGCCSIAPAMRIEKENEEEIHGSLTPEKAVKIVSEIEESEKEFEVTDNLIQKTLGYIKKKNGKIDGAEAAEYLNLEEHQFEEVIEEMKKKGIIKSRKE